MYTHKMTPIRAVGTGLVITLAVVCHGCDFCALCSHGAQGPEPEELVTIAAVLNQTTEPLTVSLAHPATTDVLQVGEAVFYSLRQSTSFREFEFSSGELVAASSLLLVSGGEMPSFQTGLLTVRQADTSEALTVSSYVAGPALYGLARGTLGAGSSVFLLVNATDDRVTVNKAGAGGIIYPDEHTAVALDGGEALAVVIEAVDVTGTPELLHVFQAPTTEDGEVSAFITFIHLQGDELVVETQAVQFQCLEWLVTPRPS